MVQTAQKKVTKKAISSKPKTRKIVLNAAARYNIGGKIFHRFDEDGNRVIYTLPEKTAEALLKKRGSKGVRYFRPAKPSDATETKPKKEPVEILDFGKIPAKSNVAEPDHNVEKKPDPVALEEDEEEEEDGIEVED